MRGTPQKTPHSPAAAPAAGVLALRERLADVYRLSQESANVFASPLGPFVAGGATLMLPRFVFFGPNATNDSWRLAFLSAFDSRDLTGAFVLTDLIERLAADADLGHGLNLSFFPVLDTAGLALGLPDRSLARTRWPGSPIPEIALLEQEARARPHHGFVRLETAPEGMDALLLRVRGMTADTLSPDLVRADPDVIQGLPVRVQFLLPDPDGGSVGPLSLAEDLPYPPFEFTVGIPAGWPESLYRPLACTLLERFLVRYRAYQAYGQHL